MSDPLATPLHIGLDFDDTLMHTREGLVALLNQLHNTTTRIEDCHDYYLSHPWKLTEDQFHAMFEAHESHLHTQPPLEGLLETLCAWSFHATFSIITGRPEEWLPSATTWLAQHNIPINNILAAKSHGGKGKIARSLNLAFFIEDHASFAKEVANAGTFVFLLDRPYNRDLHHPLITRVADWHEIRHLAAERWNLPDTSPVTISNGALS
jgi:uncharacterized HAD superfamily protein